MSKAISSRDAAQDWVQWVVGACLILSAALLLWKLRQFFHDDAFISLRYARHLALDGELAWNLGERVEGYTNLLHVLLSALLIRAGMGAMDAVHAINFCATALLAVASWRLTGLSTRDLTLRMAAMLPVVSAPVIGWVYGGLEAVLAAAFIACALFFAMPAVKGTDRLPRTLLASLFFALAYLTRPDALIANFATGLAVLALSPLSLPRKLVHFVGVGTVSALTLIAHLLIRNAYYGEWLPLTFHAKVGIATPQRLVNGLEYAGTALWAIPALLALIVLALATRSQSNAHGPVRLARAGLMIAALQSAYIIWSGGDHMSFVRIFVPVIPAAVLGAAAFMAADPRGFGRAAALTLALLALAQAALRPAQQADPAASYGAFMGLRIAEHFPEPRVVALATAGSTPFFADHHTYIDTLGLNDPVIAKRDPVPIRTPIQSYPGHGKGDGSYVLSRKPDVIIFGTAVGNPPGEPVFLTDYELLDDPDFLRCYDLRRFPVILSDNFPLTPPDMSVTPEYMYMERVCD
ncbi:hypothetical protein ACP2AV_04495 [Aliiroseovarius sp. PTFE2010]|uniref:hypothetical protein n=1 Tax=Aliiroseovarius sp. PTFE2010 TaxID=3417190 RepID=UPI003CF03862